MMHVVPDDPEHPEASGSHGEELVTVEPLINFKSITVIKDLEYICELAEGAHDWRWRERIANYRRLLNQMIDQYERPHES